MDITLRKPLAFTEIGSKPNQEDRIFPGIRALNASVRCFVLCDGMGGHEHGEVAAEIVSTTLQPALLANPTNPDIMSVDRFNTALATTYAELDKMPVDEGRRPGTTMTCLYLAANGAFVGHIGDSRVYQVRPGTGIVFRTSDHSLVNELLKAGELTPEQAANFKRRNVITRAMQPCLEVPYKADTTVLTDVRPGDYFFMCTDGILENITDNILCDILSKDQSDDKKLEDIYTLCYAHTRDNFTCILIPVDNVTGQPLPTPAPEQTDPAPTPVIPPPANATETAAVSRAKDRNHTLLYIFATIAVIAIGAAVYFACFATRDTAKTSGESAGQTQQPAPSGNVNDEVVDEGVVTEYHSADELTDINAIRDTESNPSDKEETDTDGKANPGSNKNTPASTKIAREDIHQVVENMRKAEPNLTGQTSNIVEQAAETGKRTTPRRATQHHSR